MAVLKPLIVLLPTLQPSVLVGLIDMTALGSISFETLYDAYEDLVRKAEVAAVDEVKDIEALANCQ